MFILTSFTKQSVSWKVVEICELSALSTDSQKTYSVNTLVAAAKASTRGVWGGGGYNPLGGGGGGRNGKDPRTTVLILVFKEFPQINSTIDFCTLCKRVSRFFLEKLSSHSAVNFRRGTL